MSFSSTPSISPTQTPLPPPSTQRRPTSGSTQRAAAPVTNSDFQLELEDLMRSSPSPHSDEFGPVTGPVDAIHNYNAEDSQHTPLSLSGRATSEANNSIITTVASAKRLALRKKLHPYQRDEVESFMADSVLGRQAKLFISLCMVENKLDSIVAAAPTFTISDALAENINSYTVAVLLSIKISAYKGQIPRDHVLDILKRYRLNLPTNIERDSYAWNKIKIFVQNSLTQARSRFKKAIRESKNNGNSVNIFDLATTVVASTRCGVTVQLCARLALLRKVHAETPDNKFWDEVDSHLELIRKGANGNARKVTRAFNSILSKDREMYGQKDTYSIGDADADTWQQSVDDVIAGDAAEDNDDTGM